MPLHRVCDAENFDTFDVAEMAQQTNTWYSRRGTARSFSSNNNNNNDGSVEKEDGTASTLDFSDYSSNRCTSSSQSQQQQQQCQSLGDRHSFASVGSPNSINQSNSRNNNNMINQGAIYEDYEDDNQSYNTDSRSYARRYSKGDSKPPYGGHIPEEDETSLSTMDESSVTQQQMHQSHHSLYSNYTPRHHNSLQSKKQPRNRSDGDSSSVSSNQPSRNSINDINSPTHSIVHYSTQLESRVAKLSLELATTETSLDELRLDHRRLQNEKDSLNDKVSLLQEENEQLHFKIERLEREKLLRNMEGTVGVARPIIGNSSTISGAIKTYKAQLQDKSDTGGLEIPFRSDDNEYLAASRRRDSTTSEGCVTVGSDADEALSVSSLRSYGAEKVSLYGEEDADVHEVLTLARANNNKGFFGMLGGGNQRHKQQMNEVTKQMEGASISHRSTEMNDSDEDGYDSDDPFATWSAPGDRPKRNTQKNWFQRGLGGGGNNNSRQPPQSNETEAAADPFDTFSRTRDEHESFNDTDVYTSFSANQRMNDETDQSVSTANQGKRGGGFQLFRGLGRQQERR